MVVTAAIFLPTKVTPKKMALNGCYIGGIHLRRICRRLIQTLVNKGKLNIKEHKTMNEQEKIFSRRQMLKAGMGFGGLVIVGGSVFAQQKELMATPDVEMGPFYPVLKHRRRAARRRCGSGP